MKKVSDYPRYVEPYTEDATGKLSLSFFGNELLRCAGLHATERGFGYNDMIKRNLVWVLSRLSMQFTTRPQSFEHYIIRTWVSNVYRHFTERLFEFINQEGNIIGYAHSVWAAIDYTTRKAADLEALSMYTRDDIILETKDFPLQQTNNLRIKNPKFCSERIAKFSDLDINGHVNSMRYLEMIQDVFSLQELKEKHFYRIDLQYCREGYFGDVLSLYKEQKDENSYLIEIKKTSETIVRCNILFK